MSRITSISEGVQYQLSHTISTGESHYCYNWVISSAFENYIISASDSYYQSSKGIPISKNDSQVLHSLTNTDGLTH